MKDRWTGLEPGQRPYREAASYYSEYRYKPSEEFARLLAFHLGWSKDDRLLDLGAGPAHVSMLFAPLVGEVVAMEPEENMLEEGRMRVASAGIDNLSFVHGGSADLPTLRSSLGEFAAVVISQAFHWMHDQDSVLRNLDTMLDKKRGAVALLGYVNEPDYNRVWLGLDRPPWSEIEAILERHLAEAPEGPAPRGRHDPFPEILERSPFSRIEVLSYEREVEVQPSVDAAIKFLYTLSNTLDRLGDRREAFEAEAREILEGADARAFTTQIVDSALIGRRSRSQE
jgi:SAM-dependent methyltransferase